MGRRRDKLQGSRRRQVLQLEDDGRDSFLTQYGYNSRYEEEEEDANEVPIFKQHGHVYEENMDFDSDERNPDTEDDGRSGIDFKTNGGSHSEGPQEGKKIDSELANFMAEIEAISNVAPQPDDNSEDGHEGVEKKAPDKESTPELPTRAEGKPADSDVVCVEEPVTCWQQCLDENTECYYYWRVDTNEVTWEIPPEYTQYLLQFKAFEEKVLALEQAGKTVKITGPEGSLEARSVSTEQTGDTGEKEPHVYGPFLPEKSSEDTSKGGDGDNKKGSNSAVSVVQGSGKLLSADYYDSDDASEDEADKSEKQPTETVEPEDEDLDFDIDDIDRELELALERKQAEIKAVSKNSTTEKSEESSKTTNSNDSAAIPLSPSQDASAESKHGDSITAPDKVVPETVTLMVVQDSAENVSKPNEDLKDADRLCTNSSNLLTEFKADSEEKDRNFKKLIEVKDDRASLERRERKLEERHERKSSREERRSSKEDKRSERKSDRKEDRKSEHKEKKKKDDRKEEKKSHRHKHSKGESSSREKSKHGSDYKRSLSDQEDGDLDEYRSHRKRSKHKHKDKDKDRTLTSVITAEPRPATPTDVLPPKPDTTAAPVKDEDKTVKETIVEISETVFGKLQFLEIVKEGLSGLQVLLISLETRIQDWEAGGLSNQYLLKKLQDASDQLLKYEDSAAPLGWSTHWDRNYRRYFYTNVVTGDSQWDYPDPDTETTTTKTGARVPRDWESAVTSGATDKGIKERTDGSKQDTDRVTKHAAEKVESKLEELQPLVHPGEPPPPGTETPGAGELGQASMDEESYEVSPAHSLDLEEVDDVKESQDKSPSEPKDAAVISRPPLLLGVESGDPTHANHTHAGAGAVHLDEVPNSVSSKLEVPAGISMPEVAPSAEGDRGVPDPSTSHHREKEKKKKKDKSISSSSLSLKKKKVSSLVQKWQQVQQEVEREEKSSKERESYLNRYSP